MQRYGVNRPGGQFFIQPGFGLRLFVLNTSRGIFKNNPKLRQAVNFAVDRRGLARELGPRLGTATDQYVLTVSPGFRDERIYPLKGPNLNKAKQLAKRHMRNRKVVLYTAQLGSRGSRGPDHQERTSRPSGSRSCHVTHPPPLHFQKVETLGEPFDIADAGFFGVRRAMHRSSSPSFSTVARSPMLRTSGTGRASTRRSTTG